MTDKREVARRTVRFLLRRIPKDKETLIAVGDLLGLLANIYRKVREFRNFLLSPFVEREKKREFLGSFIKKFGAPADLSEMFDYLIDINGFSMLPEIKRIYDHEVEKIMKTSKGTLLLPSELDKDIVEEIVTSIQKLTGRNLEVEVSYDPELIGGFLFKTSGLVIDTSVRRQLENLIVRGG
jgi:F-type H+-transporting ATPase subunit delta